MNGNCKSCQYYAKLELWDYTQPSVTKNKMDDGFVCLMFYQVEDGPVLYIKDFNENPDICEMYKEKQGKIKNIERIGK